MTLAKDLVKDIIVAGRALISQSIGVFTSSPRVKCFEFCTFLDLASRKHGSKLQGKAKGAIKVDRNELPLCTLRCASAFQSSYIFCRRFKASR